MRVLARDGPAGTSLSRIAREAKVSKGIICYYFDNKDGLFDAVLTSVRERLAAAAIAEALLPEDAWQQISAFIVAHLTYVRRHRTEILALRHLASTRAGGTDMSDHLAVWSDQRDWLARALAEGQECGAFKAFDVTVAATAISGALENGLLRWAHDPAIDLEAYAQQLLALFEGGVRDLRPEPTNSLQGMEADGLSCRI